MTFTFKYRSGPDWMTVKSVTKDFTDESYAEAFSEGLSKGGAGNISIEYLCGAGNISIETNKPRQ